MRGRVLIVDDDHDLCSVLRRGLERRDFSPFTTTNSNEVVGLITNDDYDAVLTDLNMRGLDGIELCARITANRPDVPVLVITAFGSLDSAREAIRAGAYDFISKPIDIDYLALSLDRAIQQRALRDEVKRLREQVANPEPVHDLIGESPVMARLHDLIHRSGSTDASVLITGESGVGKELVARALHTVSRRKGAPFVPVNCAALPEQLLESELFGHRKGAFTDARSDREGLFLRAHGGTLFLDEIATIPVQLQPKLLRALQEKRCRPVGGDREVEYDARVVAATNIDLETAVEEGRFREDLFYRLNVIHLHVPPLRSRGHDILILAQTFVERYARAMKKAVRGISPAAAERLLSYSWSGNVRELQNCIERAVALTQFEHIIIEDFPESIRAYKASHIVVAADDPEALVSMEEVERRYVLRVLQAVQGNKTEAARILGFDRKTLYRKLERWLEPDGS